MGRPPLTYATLAATADPLASASEDDGEQWQPLARRLPAPEHEPGWGLGREGRRELKAFLGDDARLNDEVAIFAQRFVRTGGCDNLTFAMDTLSDFAWAVLVALCDALRDGRLPFLLPAQQPEGCVDKNLQQLHEQLLQQFNECRAAWLEEVSASRDLRRARRWTQGKQDAVDLAMQQDVFRFMPEDAIPHEHRPYFKAALQECLKVALTGPINAPDGGGGDDAARFLAERLREAEDALEDCRSEIQELLEKRALLELRLSRAAMDSQVVADFEAVAGRSREELAALERRLELMVGKLHALGLTDEEVDGDELDVEAVLTRLFRAGVEQARRLTAECQQLREELEAKDAELQRYSELLREAERRYEAAEAAAARAAGDAANARAAAGTPPPQVVKTRASASSGAAATASDEGVGSSDTPTSPPWPDVDSPLCCASADSAAISAERAELARARAALDAERAALASERAALARDRAALEADRAALERRRRDQRGRDGPREGPSESVREVPRERGRTAPVEVAEAAESVEVAMAAAPAATAAALDPSSAPSGSARSSGRRREAAARESEELRGQLEAERRRAQELERALGELRQLFEESKAAWEEAGHDTSELGAALQRYAFGRGLENVFVRLWKDAVARLRRRAAAARKAREKAGRAQAPPPVGEGPLYVYGEGFAGEDEEQPEERVEEPEEELDPARGRYAPLITCGPFDERRRRPRPVRDMERPHSAARSAFAEHCRMLADAAAPKGTAPERERPRSAQLFQLSHLLPRPPSADMARPGGPEPPEDPEARERPAPAPPRPARSAGRLRPPPARGQSLPDLARRRALAA